MQAGLVCGGAPSADLPVVAEQADVADLDSLRAIGERHEITGIVHLAGYPAPRGTAGGI
jgi:UDP-glucose 4-epimerase